MASSLRWSNTSTSSWIDDCESSSSFLRLVRESRWVVKLLYCSKAFLLTCLYFLRASATFLRRIWICFLLEHSTYKREEEHTLLESVLANLSNASSGRTPKSRIFFAHSAADWVMRAFF